MEVLHNQSYTAGHSALADPAVDSGHGSREAGCPTEEAEEIQRSYKDASVGDRIGC